MQGGIVQCKLIRYVNKSSHDGKRGIVQKSIVLFVEVVIPACAVWDHQTVS